MEVSVEAGGDASPVLEAAEHAFHDISLTVGGYVVRPWFAAVFARRDDGCGAARHKPLAQRQAVISFIGDELRGRWQRLDQA